MGAAGEWRGAVEAEAGPSNQQALTCDRWATWPATVALVTLWFLARLIFLRWFSPFELYGDEANAWECARHLSLSYYYAGPGLALTVAGMMALFGPAQWALQLPAALAMGVTALLASRLATHLAGGDGRAGFLTAALFLLLPATILWSQIITYDPLYTALWMGATLLAWRLVTRHRAGGWAPGWWGLFGLIMGAGFLTKYTIVLLVPALLVYLALQRRSLPWDRRLAGGVALSLVAFCLTIVPFIVWNQQHDWPTRTFLSGHHTRPEGHSSLLYGGQCAGEYLLGQLAMAGPPALVLLVAAAGAAIRRRRKQAGAWADDLLLLCSGGAAILFWLLTIPFARPQANWSIAGYGPLAVLAGLYLARHWPRPGAFVRRTWLATVGFGLFCYVLAAAPHLATHLPVVGPMIKVERFHGSRDMAARVQQVIERQQREHGATPLIIGSYYDTASLLAYYLPDRPRVYCCPRDDRDRPSVYNYWPDTDLADPRLRGRQAVLVDFAPEFWHERLVFRNLRVMSPGPIPVYLVDDYGGVREAPGAAPR